MTKQAQVKSEMNILPAKADVIFKMLFGDNRNKEEWTAIKNIDK